MRSGLHSDFYLFKAELKDTTQVTSVNRLRVTSPSSSSCKVGKAGKKKGKFVICVDLFILNCCSVLAPAFWVANLTGGSTPEKANKTSDWKIRNSDFQLIPEHTTTIPRVFCFSAATTATSYHLIIVFQFNTLNHTLCWLLPLSFGVPAWMPCHFSGSGSAYLPRLTSLGWSAHIPEYFINMPPQQTLKNTGLSVICLMLDQKTR